MCASTSKGRPYHPKWIIELGGRELECRYGDNGPFPVPDLDDPVVLRHHLDFIRRLGAQYDGHPDIDHVDLGTVGWRADCLGDLGGFSDTWNHMRQRYPLWIRQAGIENVWKSAPVAWESCWDMRKWVAEGWLPGSIELFHDEFFEVPGDLPPGAVHEVSERLVLPSDLPNGQYRLSIGVIDASELPVVRLGIAGRDEAGWYPLSHVSLER